MTDDAGDRREPDVSHARSSTSTAVQGERARGARRSRSCSRRWRGTAQPASSTAAPQAAAPRCRSSRRCATRARDIKDHTLAHLDLYLEALRGAGASRPAATCIARATPRRRAQTILDICREAGAKHRHQGQVDDRRGDRPQRLPRGERHRAGRDRSRRIHHPAPRRAAEPHHRARRASHQGPGRGRFPPRPHRISPPDRNLDEPATLLAEARAMLREHFLAADVGITGANFLIAETGTSIIVTNEGNGDLTQTLPQDAYRARHRSRRSCRRSRTRRTLLRVLARSATGQEISVYTTLLDRPAPRRRSRRAGGISRRAPRQRPLRDARQRVPGHAALHPLRRLHEPLPGLSRRSAAMPMAGSIRGRWARC